MFVQMLVKKEEYLKKTNMDLVFTGLVYGHITKQQHYFAKNVAKQFKKQLMFVMFAISRESE